MEEKLRLPFSLGENQGKLSAVRGQIRLLILFLNLILIFGCGYSVHLLMCFSLVHNKQCGGAVGMKCALALPLSCAYSSGIIDGIFDILFSIFISADVQTEIIFRKYP